MPLHITYCKNWGLKVPKRRADGKSRGSHKRKWLRKIVAILAKAILKVGKDLKDLRDVWRQMPVDAE